MNIYRKKETGSYYTPQKLVDYMVEWISNRLNINNVLEPSVGDGRFVKALLNYNYNVHAVEIDKNKIDDLKRNNYKVDMTNDDYLNFSR